jgi:hypothetical protein
MQFDPRDARGTFLINLVSLYRTVHSIPYNHGCESLKRNKWHKIEVYVSHSSIVVTYLLNIPAYMYMGDLQRQREKFDPSGKWTTIISLTEIKQLWEEGSSEKN